ncbi:MAG: M20/M25/M40 family metallo-hydrolase [Chitinophagaceae bacterium]
MGNRDLHTLQQDAIELLKELIATPSFSKEEDQSAGIISRFLAVKGLETTRISNNVFSLNRYFDSSKPTILLNSHHDTVRPNPQYIKNPFSPIIENGKLYGLGSNDAGGALVSLIAAFLYFYEEQNLKYNLVLAATAEEEISGTNGIEALLQSKFFPEAIAGDKLHPFEGSGAIVGEPTGMQMAIAEKGLIVIDCISQGTAGHAAQAYRFLSGGQGLAGENAIYKAMDDIHWIKNNGFERVSDLLGPVTMSVTTIETENKLHNVIPGECRFVIDVRINELYSHEEILKILKTNLQSQVNPRSMRLRSTFIPLEHPLVKAGLKLNRSYYGSPTTSDKALIPLPTLKMGPGDSARSHIADEYIFLEEIKDGINIYIRLLNQVLE